MEVISNYRTVKQCVKSKPKHHGIKYNYHEKRNDLSRDSSFPTPLLSHSMLLHQDVCLRGKCKGQELLKCGLSIFISRPRDWASWFITDRVSLRKIKQGKPCKKSILLWRSRDYLLIRIAIIYLLTYLFTYLLTPWRRVLFEKLTGFKLVKNFPALYGTRSFITAFTSACHLSLYWASSIQSISPHPTFWKSILILSSHLLLCLPSVLFHSGFPTKTLNTPFLSPIRATCPAHLILLCFMYSY